MNINIIKNVLDTLPIGYYLGRNIDVELSTGDNSYFAVEQDKIVIGAQAIIDAFNAIDESKQNQYDIECVVRGLLYHEISHVILTPKFSISSSIDFDIVNIFEDERIEYLLKDFYMNTSFKKNVIFLNQLTDGIPEPRSGRDLFYQIVRYHKGPQYYVNHVARIIYAYRNLNASHNYSDSYTYVDSVMRLYRDICNEFDKNYRNSNNSNNSNSSNNPNSSNNSNNSNNQSNSNSNNSNTPNNSNTSNTPNTSNTSNTSANKSNNSSKERSDNTSSNSLNNSSTTDSHDSTSDVSNNSNSTTAGTDYVNITTKDSKIFSPDNNEVDNIIKDLYTAMSSSDIAKIIDKAICKTINKYYDSKLVLKLKKIIAQKMKQKNKNGTAISSYSGRFNVRAVADRDDYKWWAQQNRAGHINMYSKVHFNLFIDNSGSFSRNDDNMNKFIQAMNKIVSKDFEFDVITINTFIREWDNTTSRLFMSSGGTHLSKHIKDVIKKHTVRNANNYNIVLFDGDASPDRCNKNNAFSYFDSPHTIIVTDGSNRRYIENAHITKARVIITDDYCHKFISSVLTLLEQVL